MKVSLIVLIYNHKKYLPDLFRSIELNTREIGEVIFVDNASTDNSFQLVEDYKNNYSGTITFKCIQYQHPLKVGAALNITFTQANNSFVSFISGDDFLLNKRYVQQVQAVEENSNLDFVYSNGLFCNEAGLVSKHVIIPKEIINLFANKSNSNKDTLYYLAPALFVQCGLYKKSSLASIGGFDESLIIEDWPLHISLFSKYPKTNMFLDENVTAYRQHSDNAYKISFRQYIGQKQVLLKYSKGKLLRKGLYILYMRQALYFLKCKQNKRCKVFLKHALSQSPGLYFSTQFLVNEFKRKFKKI